MAIATNRINHLARFIDTSPLSTIASRSLAQNVRAAPLATPPEHMAHRRSRGRG
jgi:hypothetical protein